MPPAATHLGQGALHRTRQPGLSPRPSGSALDSVRRPIDQEQQAKLDHGVDLIRTRVRSLQLAPLGEVYPASGKAQAHSNRWPHPKPSDLLRNRENLACLLGS